MQPFYPNDYEKARTRGAIPMVDWNSWNLGAGSGDQSAFQLRDVISGAHDSYIRSWATAAKNYGRPFFLRFDHEMNGGWYPWSETANGNASGEYVQAWRHVHDIFESVGATNVNWVWCPNVVFAGSTPLAGLYPGDADVDWVAMDGYNWGTNPAKPSGWQSFTQVFKPTYDQLGVLAPAKPVMIAETSSTEFGGSKAAWITDALTAIPTAFPRIRALVWFDWNTDGMDWIVSSSASSTSAFAAGIASPVYAGNAFASLPSAKIAPPS
jgi:beta-mannanase